MTSGAKTPVFLEPLAARLKGVPFRNRGGRGRRGRRYSLFSAAVKERPSHTIYGSSLRLMQEDEALS